MKKPEYICIFGDSTAWGAWDMEKGGWVNRLWFDVAENTDPFIEIYNQSISGGTSETILKRFENEALTRKAEAIIFQTGANDASTLKDRTEPYVSVEKFRENINEILIRAKKITDKIIFMSLRNCDESKTTPVYWADIYYRNKDLEKYSKIIKEVCLEHNVKFLDIGMFEDDEFDDGLHPNAKGHQKIFEKVRGFLIESGWI